MRTCSHRFRSHISPPSAHRLPRGRSLQGWGLHPHPGPTCRPAVPRIEGGGRLTLPCPSLMNHCRAARAVGVKGPWDMGARGPDSRGLYTSQRAGHTLGQMQGQLSSPHSKPPPAESPPQLKRPGKQRPSEPADGVRAAGVSEGKSPEHPAGSRSRPTSTRSPRDHHRASHASLP